MLGRKTVRSPEMIFHQDAGSVPSDAGTPVSHRLGPLSRPVRPCHVHGLLTSCLLLLGSSYRSFAGKIDYNAHRPQSTVLQTYSEAHRQRRRPKADQTFVSIDHSYPSIQS